MDGMSFSLVCCFLGCDSTTDTEWHIVPVGVCGLAGAQQSVGVLEIGSSRAASPGYPDLSPLSVTQLRLYIRHVSPYYSSLLVSPALVPSRTEYDPERLTLCRDLSSTGYGPRITSSRRCCDSLYP